MKKIMQSAAIAALLTLGMTSALKADDKGGNNQNQAQTRLRAKLTGPAIAGKTPEGHADFRSRAGGRMSLEVEAENVNLAAGTVLTVKFIHGATTTTLGTLTLSALGAGELELESENGAAVPTVVAGDMVTVSNGATVILAGVF